MRIIAYIIWMSKKTPEGMIVAAICEYLALKEKAGHGMYWKVRNQTYNARAKCHIVDNSPIAKVGIPDIEGILNGQYIGIEVKVPKSPTTKKTYQSKEQKIFQALVEKSGGIYIVARSIDDVEELFK